MPYRIRTKETLPYGVGTLPMISASGGVVALEKTAVPVEWGSSGKSIRLVLCCEHPGRLPQVGFVAHDYCASGQIAAQRKTASCSV